MELRQAVDGVVEDGRVRMLEAVPARVVGRVAQAEVRPKVDDGGAAGGQVRGARRGRAVRQGEEDGVSLGQLAVDGETGRGEVRVVAADRLVVAVPAGQSDDV